MEDRQKVVKNFCADSELAHFWLFFSTVSSACLPPILLAMATTWSGVRPWAWHSTGNSRCTVCEKFLC